MKGSGRSETQCTFCQVEVARAGAGSPVGRLIESSRVRGESGLGLEGG